MSIPVRELPVNASMVLLRNVATLNLSLHYETMRFLYRLRATHILATGVVLDTNGNLLRASNMPTQNRINAGLVGILHSLKGGQ